MSIDSGGSKTLCLIQSADGELLGWGRGGGTNNMSFEHCRCAFQSAIEGALASSGIPAGSIARTFFSTLGKVEAFIEARLQSGVTGDLISFGDSQVALYASVCNNSGVVALSGTGSFVYGRHPNGRSRLLGGLGDICGDEGSGYQIGLQGLRAALRMLEGWGEETKLAAAIADNWSLPQIEPNPALERNITTQHITGQVLQRLPDSYRQLVAGLSKVVAMCAREGDQVSRAIIAKAGQDLADQIVSLSRQLEMNMDPLPVGCTGGCWRIGDLLLDAFKERLEERLQQPFYIVADPMEPVFGVYLAGLEHMRIPWSEELLVRVRAGNAGVKACIA